MSDYLALKICGANYAPGPKVSSFLNISSVVMTKWDEARAFCAGLLRGAEGCSEAVGSGFEAN